MIGVNHRPCVHARSVPPTRRSTLDTKRQRAHRSFVWFTAFPLAVMGLVSTGALALRPADLRSLEPLPWLVALLVVGLPHGAADLEVQRLVRGAPAVRRVLVLYVAGITVVLVGLVNAPLTTLAGFLILSLWHFGQVDEPASAAGSPTGEGVVAILARGSLVMGLPLAMWPESSAGVIRELIDLVGPMREACGLPSLVTATVAASPIAMTGRAVLCLGIACWLRKLLTATLQSRSDQPTRGPFNDLVSFLLIGLLFVSVPPLLATGVFFLFWHAWRQQPQIASRLSSRAEDTHPMDQVICVHRAAMPLLIPAWLVLGIAWWCLVPEHTPRSLALLSLLLYVAVTPAHEILCSLTKPVIRTHLPRLA